MDLKQPLIVQQRVVANKPTRKIKTSIKILKFKRKKGRRNNEQTEQIEHK
jgi:hypothetical protein